MDKVIHFEIPAEDTERADKFYSQVFGWNINKAPLDEGYGRFKDPEGNILGLWQNLDGA
jgi:uncharacterized protein